MLQFGLSVQETDGLGITPLYYLCRAEDDPKKALDIYRYLSAQGALDEVMQDLFLPKYRTSKQSSLYRFVWRNSELLEFIITEFHPAFYRSSIQRCFKSITWIYVNPKVLVNVLTLKNIISPKEVLAQICESGLSSLHAFAGLYFQKYLSSLDTSSTVTTSDDFGHWRELARWMFKGIASEDICLVHHEPWEHVTPLFAGLLSCEPTLETRPSKLESCRRLSAALNVWLEDLHHAGVDLKTYGEQEWSFYRQDDLLQSWRWNNLTLNPDESTLNEEGPVLASFTHGPQPSDWTLRWDFGPE